MNFQIENLWILFGLFALAVPIVLHLLRRRRFDTLDWGAMQFLPDSVSTQRKRWLDEILLMLMRMAMIALIVIALATPISVGSWLPTFSDQATRDMVVILDGSYSMNVRVPNQLTPWAEAIQWARATMNQAGSSDRITFIIARQPPLVLQDPSFDDLAAMIPRGNADMPGALAEAWKHLQGSKATTKEIIVLTDGQKHGWADSGTLAALDTLGHQWDADGQQARTAGRAFPSLRVVKVGADLPKSLPNYSLAPLTSSHGVAKVGQKITFQSALLVNQSDKVELPLSAKVLIDGKEAQTIVLPATTEVKAEKLPFQFMASFDKVGQHVVSLRVDADDVLAADNEQHAVIHVVKELPILLVDGDKQLSAQSSSFFLHRAFGSKQLPYSKWRAIDADQVAVIVLADVPHLDAAQIEAIDRFLADGGGLLIMAGERMARAKAFYNEVLYRHGEGWFPVALGEIATAKEGVHPDLRSFQHPALELLRASPDGTMQHVRFSKWWKVSPGPKDRTTLIAKLSNGDPFVLEKAYKQGRVILCTIPPDRQWESTLPATWEYPIVMHELVHFAAGNRNVTSVLKQGSAIRLAGTESSRQLTLRTPEVREEIIDVKSGPWIFGNTGAIGVYQVQESASRSWSFVVPPDLRESNLTRCGDDDWGMIRHRLRTVWKSEDAAHSSTPGDAGRKELWWLLLLAVLGLLCTEVWMTRRMALARGR
jgi:hypothetical protein